jgi:hypothetical protein
MVPLEQIDIIYSTMQVNKNEAEVYSNKNI